LITEKSVVEGALKPESESPSDYDFILNWNDALISGRLIKLTSPAARKQFGASSSLHWRPKPKDQGLVTISFYSSLSLDDSVDTTEVGGVVEVLEVD
jgi:hypothetical protein